MAQAKLAAFASTGRQVLVLSLISHSLDPSFPLCITIELIFSETFIQMTSSLSIFLACCVTLVGAV